MNLQTLVLFSCVLTVTDVDAISTSPSLILSVNAAPEMFALYLWYHTRRDLSLRTLMGHSSTGRGVKYVIAV
jgi:hypothetical protein